MKQIKTNGTAPKISVSEYLSMFGHEITAMWLHHAGQTAKNEHACAVLTVEFKCGQDFDGLRRNRRTGKDELFHHEKGYNYQIDIWPRYNCKDDELDLLFEPADADGKRKAKSSSVSDATLVFYTYEDTETKKSSISMTYTNLVTGDGELFRPQGAWRGLNGADVTFDDNGNADKAADVTFDDNGNADKAADVTFDDNGNADKAAE